MRRTKWNALAFLFSGALILAACGQQPGESAEESEPTGSQPAGSQPATGGEGTGTITYAIDGQLTTLSNANADVPTAEAFSFIGAALYGYDATLTPVPDLAADLCEVSEDDLVWTCTLTDATFHNGDPVTAADVVFTYEIAQSANCRFNPSVCLAPFLESATAVDDTTVEFTLLEPYAPFATVILPGIAIDSEAVVTAAFEDFAGEAEGADPAEVTEAMDALNAAAAPEEGDPDPAACEAGIAAGEAAIESAGVEVPSADEFNTGGENADEYDPCAHATALADLLSQILATLEEEGVDAIAAVYPLLSFNSEPVNAGPYMCEPGCFAPGENLTLTAFADYHAGAPATETIVMPIITDEVQIANAVQAGQVDWHYSVPSDAYSALEGDPNVKFAEYPDFGYFSLQYNLREGQLFADLGARKAVQYCIDKAATVEQATNGQGIPVEADIPPASWAFNPNLETVERNVEQAIGFLEEAGWTVETDADGNATGPATRGDETFSTQVYVRAGQPERIRFMELLRDQVADCGIEIEVIEGDFATVLLPLLTYPHIPPNADEPYDAYFGGWSTGFDPDPFALFHSSQCTTEEQPELYNYVCWQNEEADALIDEGLVVSDQEERAAIYQGFEQIVYDQQPYLFAWSDTAREAIDVNLQSTAGELELGSPQWDWQLETLFVSE